MPFSFSPNILPYVTSNIIAAMRTPKPPARLPSTPYALGDRVANGSYIYICVQPGTTNTGPGPVGTTGRQFDGTVQWLYTGSNSISADAINANLYLGIGKQVEWDDPAVPPVPDMTPAGLDSDFDEMTALLQVGADNIRLGIRRNGWTNGQVYSQYDPTQVQTSYANPIYVLVDDTVIYLCLDNNNGAPSTESPSGIGQAPIETADGYIWRYIGTINAKELYDFGTATFVPTPSAASVAVGNIGEISTFKDVQSTTTPFDETDVIKTAVIGDGTGAVATPRLNISGGQANVVGFFASSLGTGYTDAYAIAYKDGETGTGANVSVNLTNDEVSAVVVDAPGTDYNTASVLIVGDGTGATADVTVSGGQVTNITLTSGGAGYTWAKAFVIPGDAGAVAHAVMAPSGGIGSSVETLLNASTVLISVRLASSLNNYIPISSNDNDGTFRQVMLVSGVDGTTRNAQAYQGPSHPNYTAADGLNKYRVGSGYILYVNNVVAITHTSSQEETIKVSITL